MDGQGGCTFKKNKKKLVHKTEISNWYFNNKYKKNDFIEK